MSRRMIAVGVVVLLFLAFPIAPGRAQQVQRYLYAALPGVGGGSNTSYGGVGILVFDIDNKHRFVRRVPLQGAPPPPTARGTVAADHDDAAG